MGHDIAYCDMCNEPKFYPDAFGKKYCLSCEEKIGDVVARDALNRIARYRKKKQNNIFDDFYHHHLDFIVECIEFYRQSRKKEETNENK